MALEPGTRFGPYEIAATLGAGGMGEVYRATDTRLKRDVAIKVLKSEVGTDVERLRRMEQEALATAALNHPNIVAVYDVGTDQGRSYVVAELLEGETLRERLQQGALPVRKAVDFAVQLTNGLAAAHQKGITHRDLKPENLFVTRDGRLKILDFGLAKIVPPVPAAGGAVSTGLPGTEPGLVMGTLGYMAPEQLRGQAVDHRSDIFSTGAVLYEMLSGERAFRGDSPADTVSAILHQDPASLTASARHIPPALQRIVDRCLEKDPNERFYSVHDLGIALDAVSGSGSDVGAIAPARGRRINAGWVAAALSVVAAVLALAWGIGRGDQPPAESPLVRFSVTGPPDTTFVDAEASMPVIQLAISPNGQHLAFIAKKSGSTPMVWVRRIDGLEATTVPGTEGAFYPFWSPDSRSLGFFADNRIKRIDLDGGRAQALGDAINPRGGTWNGNGIILFGAGNSGAGLFRVAAAGGAVQEATTLDQSRGETSHRWPQFLPGGEHFVYHVRSNQAGRRGLYLGSLDGSPSQLLVENAEAGLYAEPGRLLFVRDRVLAMLRWNGSSFRTEGDPVVIAQDVNASSTSYGPISASNNGILAIGARTAALSQPTWFNRAGHATGTAGPVDDYIDFRLSPDERVIAMARADPTSVGSDIWLFDRRRTSMTRATFAPGVDSSPVWSPDGSRILLRTNRTGMIEFMELTVGESAERHVATPGYTGTPTDWSERSARVVYTTTRPQTGSDLYLLEPQKGTMEPFLEAPFNQMQGVFSSDGRWMAYTSNESGQWEVYARSTAAAGRKIQLSTRGGVQAFWRRDMKELFYLALDGTVMRVPLTVGSTLDPGPPEAMFQTRVSPDFDNMYRTHYAATKDGQQFLVNEPVQTTTASSITVIVNWTRSVVPGDGTGVQR